MGTFTVLGIPELCFSLCSAMSETEPLSASASATLTLIKWQKDYIFDRIRNVGERETILVILTSFYSDEKMMKEVNAAPKP